MEKQLAEERDKDWQGQTHQDGEERKASTQEAWICPCGVYSRTSHRLRLALGGRNAVDIPQHPVITADCCECMLCFPCKCLISAPSSSRSGTDSSKSMACSSPSFKTRSARFMPLMAAWPRIGAMVVFALVPPWHGTKRKSSIESNFAKRSRMENLPSAWSRARTSRHLRWEVLRH